MYLTTYFAVPYISYSSKSGKIGLLLAGLLEAPLGYNVLVADGHDVLVGDRLVS